VDVQQRLVQFTALRNLEYAAGKRGSPEFRLGKWHFGLLFNGFMISDHASADFGRLIKHQACIDGTNMLPWLQLKDEKTVLANPRLYYG